MAPVVAVDDPADPRLADYVGLNDAALRRRIEAEGGAGHGILIAEGLTAIGRLLTSPYPIRSILVTPAKLDRLLAQRGPHHGRLEQLDRPVFVASPAVLEAVAGFDLHRGAVAAADRLPPRPLTEVVATAGAVAVLEGLNDHENLGAIARCAAALGIDALLLDPTCADPLYRRSVRVSMGEVLHLPFTTVTPWPDVLGGLRDAGWRLVALTPSPDAMPLEALRVDQGERVALLLGAEGPGLSAAAMACASQRVCIPLVHGVDSLNVGHAAVIAFHHLRAYRLPTTPR